MPIYTDAQKEDIQERTNKALEALKELNLYPACVMSKERMTTTDGQEVFVDKVQPYLRDTFYVVDGDKYILPKEEKKEDVA